MGFAALYPSYPLIKPESAKGPLNVEIVDYH
jgi:hypothetical protein